MEHLLGNPRERFVMQFEDGNFLQTGLWHGFHHPNEYGSYEKTDKLEQASTFAFNWQLDRAVYDLDIGESYKIKRVKITYELAE